MTLHAQTDGHEIRIDGSTVERAEDYAGSTMVWFNDGNAPIQVQESPAEVWRRKHADN